MSEEPSGTESAPKKTRGKLAVLEGMKGSTPMNFLANYEVYLDRENKERTRPISGTQVWNKLNSLQPKRFNSLLGRPFIIDDHRVREISSAQELFGILHTSEMKIDWNERGGSLTKSEFYHVIGMLADTYRAVCKYPHSPKLDRTFYIHDIEPKATGKFDEFLSLFCPATELDRICLRAAFLTLLWGDEGGKKPAFVFDGLDEDRATDGKKRGLGKSTIVEMMGLLIDEGYVDLKPQMDVEDMKKRLMEAKSRIIRFDNVKSAFISSEAIENLITSHIISGHKMYVGQQEIPNRFIYTFTFNDAKFSTDLSQRAVLIRLARPKYTKNWSERIEALIRDHRQDIIADMLHLLGSQTPSEDAQLRFPGWEVSVLNKCGLIDGKTVGGLIRDAQRAVDESDEVVEELTDLIGSKISEYHTGKSTPEGRVHLDPESDTVAIKQSVLSTWAKELFGKNRGAMAYKRWLQLYRPPQLSLDIHKINGTKYLIWNANTRDQGAENWKITEPRVPGKDNDTAERWHRDRANGVNFKKSSLKSDPPKKGVESMI